jgi:Cytotoxic
MRGRGREHTFHSRGSAKADGQLSDKPPSPSANAAWLSNGVKCQAKTRVGKGSSLRKRWKDQDGTMYEWDSRHGTIEKYDSRGIHQGEFDPNTGNRLKPADPIRRVEP